MILDEFNNLRTPGCRKEHSGQKDSYCYGILHITTGNILRSNIGEGTKLGLVAKAYMDKGELVTDEVLIGIIKNRLKEKDYNKGIVIDG